MTITSTRGTALITGASTGIGAVYADRLASRGYDLVLVARDLVKLEALAQRLRGASGGKVEVLQADLTVKADLLRVAERIGTDATLTALVNNAGLGAARPLIESDPDVMEEMISLNVVALTRLAGAAARAFAVRGKGVIVNISSIAALAPEVLNGVYSGTKAYVLNLTQSMHHELGARGVQVQAVLPGATSTPFWEVAGVPLEHLPADIVMPVDAMVDAALAGLDRGELVTVPSLPDVAQWETFNAARQAMGPNLSRREAAARYR